MDKKKLLLVIGIGLLAAALLTVFLLRGGEDAPGRPAVTTCPALQEQTAQTAPSDTTAPEEEIQTIPEETTEPVQTRPEETEPDDPEPEQTEAPAYTEPELFPLELEDGMLVVQSLFQFSGMNPDFDNLFGEDIAGVQLVNDSDAHMTYAEVTAILADGTTLTFVAEDVPAGGTVMAFCLEHESVTDVRACEEVFGYAEFETGDMLMEDLVKVTVTGAEITLKNVSGRDLTNLEVICHGLLDGSLFGGITYHYNVSTLPAGSSAVVHAVDCFLGMTEVVRIKQGS